MRRARRAARLATAIVVAGLVGVLSLGAAQSASAHDYLVSTSPVADSTVTDALSEVSLTFNEPPLDDSGAAIAMEVHDPSGANTTVGSISIVNSTLSIAVEPTSNGPYTVLWQTISADGHAVSGQFGFDYAGPVVAATSPPPPRASDDASATPGAGTSSPGSPGSASPTTAPPVSTTGAAATADDGLQLPLVLIGVGSALAVLLVVGVVVVIVLRRRSRAAPATAPREVPED